MPRTRRGARRVLPKGVKDAVLNRDQLARAMDVSLPTITRWVDEGMPVLERGSHGKSYRFQLSACWEWHQKRRAEDARLSAQAEQSVRKLRVALLGAETGDANRELSPAERNAIYEAERAWARVARERGELIPRQSVVELLEDVLGVIRDSVTALPDRLAREVGLSPRQIEQAVEACDDMLEEAARRIREAHLEPEERREAKAEKRNAARH